MCGRMTDRREVIKTIKISYDLREISHEHRSVVMNEPREGPLGRTEKAAKKKRKPAKKIRENFYANLEVAIAHAESNVWHDSPADRLLRVAGDNLFGGVKFDDIGRHQGRGRRWGSIPREVRMDDRNLRASH